MQTQLLKTEIWKDVPEWENIYQVSTIGRVRSLDKMTKSRPAKGRIRKPNIQNSGYLFVSFHEKGKAKNFLIHRLVAIIFLEKIDGKDFVNHKNGIKTDNRVENLEWCNKSENLKHAFDTGLKTITKRHLDRLIKWNKTEHGIKVSQYTKFGEFVQSFGTMVEASEKTGLNYNAIVDCVQGRHKTCGGFVFKKTTPFDV